MRLSWAQFGHKHPGLTESVRPPAAAATAESSGVVLEQIHRGKSSPCRQLRDPRAVYNSQSISIHVDRIGAGASGSFEGALQLAGRPGLQDL